MTVHCSSNFISLLQFCNILTDVPRKRNTIAKNVLNEKCKGKFKLSFCITTILCVSIRFFKKRQNTAGSCRHFENDRFCHFLTHFAQKQIEILKNGYMENVKENLGFNLWSYIPCISTWFFKKKVKIRSTSTSHFQNV